MIVPSIDLRGGQTVQLVGGRDLALEAGDPRPLARGFGRVGEVAVVDLDAALGTGDNRGLIEELLPLAACRVGGGIRDVDAALGWLDAGAAKVVLGTAAVPDVLAKLPRERVVAALDAECGEVVVDGWRRRTGRGIADRMRELRGLVGGFLVTFVEREGRMQGTDLDAVGALREAAGDATLTIAGGITTAEEIAALDRLGAEAQIGMALYTGRIDLAAAFCAPLVSDRHDGLWPTLVVDELGTALGLTWSSCDSVRAALAERRGVYHSRKRGLWRKGETSGAKQELIDIAVDCDRDALRFTVRQHGAGFCHLGAATCFGPLRGLQALESTVRARGAAAPSGSYVGRLLADPELLAAKLREEADELADARAPADVAHEAADVVFFAAVAMARAGVRFADLASELDRRALAVRRRSEREEKGDG